MFGKTQDTMKWDPRDGRDTEQLNLYFIYLGDVNVSKKLKVTDRLFVISVS